MVRKFVLWKTNKEQSEDYPAFVVHFTDFSPNRKTGRWSASCGSRTPSSRSTPSGKGSRAATWPRAGNCERSRRSPSRLKSRPRLLWKRRRSKRPRRWRLRANEADAARQESRGSHRAGIGPGGRGRAEDGPVRADDQEALAEEEERMTGIPGSPYFRPSPPPCHSLPPRV